MDPLREASRILAAERACQCGHPKGHHASNQLGGDPTWRQCENPGCPCEAYHPEARVIDPLNQDTFYRLAQIADRFD